MKNTLIDLNNHLFAQLERLGDEDLKDEDLMTEIERSKAIQGIASQAINNAKLVLDAEKLKMEYGGNKELPAMLQDKKNG
jgi:hypothetical protein